MSTAISAALLLPSFGQAATYSPADALVQVQLCQAAYCDSEDALPTDFDVTAVINEQSRLPGARALVGCSASTFWVAYRGSSNVQNWADNLKFFKTRPYDDKDIEVDKGFYDWYGALKSGVSDALVAAALHDPRCASAAESEWALTITGHSAGGAVATLHAFDVLHNNDGMGGAFSLTSVHTYGSPRVGNEAFVAAHDARMQASDIGSFRVTHNRDLVPHLPPERLHFHHVATEVFYGEDSSSYEVCTGTGEDAHCSNTCAPLHCTSVDDHLEYLGVPLGSTNC